MKYASSASSPRPARVAILPALLAGEPARSALPDRVEQVGAQRRLDRRGHPGGDRALGPEHGRASGHGGDEPDQGGPVEAAPGGGGEQVGEGGGLGDDQPGGEHPEPAEHGDLGPGRGDPAQ